MKKPTNISQKVGQFLSWTAFLLAGLLGYLHNTLGNLDYIPGDLGDARFNGVILEHLYRYLFGKVHVLSEPGFFYPFQNILWFSDTHFGSGVVYILGRAAGLSRESAFQFWFLFGNVLNFLAAYYSAKKLGMKPFAAGVSAFVFSFSLVALAREGFAQLTYRFPVPLVGLYFYQFIESGQLGKLKAVIFLLCWQVAISIYLGIFLIYLLIAMMGAHWYMDKVSPYRLFKNSLGNLPRREIFKLLSFVLPLLGMIAWLLIQYRMTSKLYGFFRPVAEINSMTPRLSSYLVADSSTLTGWIGKALAVDLPMRHEHQMFFGVGVICLVVAGLAVKLPDQRQRTLQVSAGLTLLIMVLMTLRIQDFSLYVVFRSLPGVNAVRAVSRVCEVMSWPVAVLSGLGCISLMRHVAQASLTIRSLTAISIFLLVTVESWMFVPMHTRVDEWQARSTQLINALPTNIASDAILYVPSKKGELFFMSELDAAIVAQDLNIVTLNGYSGNATPGTVYPAPCAGAEALLAAYLKFKHLPASQLVDFKSRIIEPTGVSCQ